MPKHAHKRRSGRRARLWACAAVVLSIGVAAGWARAADPVAELAALDAAALDTAGAPAARARAAREADELRARLIESRPEDERAATWMLDRSTYLLDRAGEGHGPGGADLSCLFGVPTRAQTAHVRPLAEAALELAERADAHAARTVAALEARLIDRSRGPDAAALAQVEARLAELVEVEQSRRIPMIRALARTLLASIASEPARAATIAREAAGELEALRSGPDDVARRVALATALIHAARLGGEGAAAFDERARAEVRALASHPAVTVAGGGGGATAVRACLLRHRLGAGEATPCLGGGKETPMELEAQAACWVEQASRDIAARTEHIGRAVRALAAAAPSAERIAAGEPDTRIEIAEKIASVLPKAIPLSALPPEAGFARAVMIARSRDAGAPAREEAAAMFGAVAERTDAASGLRCSARWERAVVLSDLGREIESFDALARVFTDDASCPEALPAARRVAGEYLRRRGSGGRMPDPWRDRVGVHRAAIELLLTRQPEDRWRIELVRLLCDDLKAVAGPAANGGTGGADVSAVIDRAAAVIDQVGSADVRVGLNRELSDALVLHLDRCRSAAAANSESPTAWGAMAPAARKAAAWAAKGDPARVSAMTVTLGEALAYSGDRSAIEVLAPLAGGVADSPGSPLFTRYRFALARAHRLHGEEAKAFAVLREAAGALEGEPGAKTREAAFWAAWVEMLRILETLNRDGSRSADIRVQIKRLELLDPTLGGPPYAEQIGRVRAAVGE